MTGMDDAFCSSTRPRRSMHRARADRVGHRAPEVSYRASSRPIVGLSKGQSPCSRDLYHPHARLAGLPGYVAGVRCVSLDVHQTSEKSSYRKLRELEDMKRAGAALDPGSLLSGHADGFGVAPPPLSQRSARTDVGPSLCFLSRSFTLQTISRTWLRHRCRFDLYQNVRMIKACDTEKRAYLTAPTLCEAVFNLGRPRFQGAIDIRGVEVQTDHIRHLEPGIIQNRFQVIQALGYLGAHVPRMERVSFGVNGDLSRAIEDALRVADLVGLDEPVRVLPSPGVDDSPICCHTCLLLPPLFPGGLWLHRCIVEPREVQH